MVEFELATESNPLLGEHRGVEAYMRKPRRLTKAARHSLTFIAVSVVGLFIVVLLLQFTPSLRRHNPPASGKDPPVDSPLVDFPVTQLEPEFFNDYGSKRVKIKYGPFTVPGNDVKNGMKNFRIQDAKLPCQGCLIIWIHADLEFADSSYANADKGIWFHHTVLLNRGRAAVRSCQPMPERFFAAGNERTVFDLTLNGAEKSGYWLEESDKAIMATELMNKAVDSQDAIVTITYEYIPYMPPDFSVLIPVWLDVGECQRSEVPVPDGKPSFELSMTPWSATISGAILSIGSHIHDGGLYIDVLKNDELVCRSVATYGDAAEMDMSHISHMSGCHYPDRIEEGEAWSLKAKYDLDAHEPMLDENGKPEGVMAIALILVIKD